jgi:hypothetical protein
LPSDVVDGVTDILGVSSRNHLALKCLLMKRVLGFLPMSYVDPRHALNPRV